jgi:hydrogenase/urease accessory protein HupE
VAPIEAGIALSILFLAREVAIPNSESLARRYPLAISSSFGLLHGFGFAAALSE